MPRGPRVSTRSQDESSAGEKPTSATRVRVEPARKPLRLLLVEDSDDDELLVVRELEMGGYAPFVTRVQTSAEFKAALDGAPPDIIVSDHAVPGYGGLAALADLKATGKDIPFILVSGTVGEGVAVSAMRAGAHDYVMKGDLTRLPAAVERELREHVVRSERAKMREQLVISERMASAGTLAAGVAHEINNPLGVAMGNLEFVVEFLARISPSGAAGAEAEPTASVERGHLAALAEPLQDMREALGRIRDIVRDVKLFSRPPEDKGGPVDVHRVIDSSVRMAWNEIRHRAHLVKDYGAVPLVSANESRLGQVVLNLVVNAAQAMPEGNVHGNRLRVATRTTEDGHAVIEVTDTGCGIPAHNLERIFDPFYTTKPVGVGTGLGLAICHRLVLELGGAIEVDSEVGRGTTFRVLLPPATPHVAPEADAPRPAPRHRAHVLVVDDEVMIGVALERNLRVHHDVVALTSAKEALSRIAAGQRFDVIVTDLMMPDLTGMELHARVLSIAPDQARRMIFMTGGAFTVAAREFLHTVPNPRIDKPIESANLLALISGLAATPLAVAPDPSRPAPVARVRRSSPPPPSMR
jgi:signal transduction histidine kinase